MKYHTEKLHPSIDSSLRAGEKAVHPVGDPKTEDRDNREEVRAGLKPPGTPDPRVVDSQRDQGKIK